MFVTLAGYTYDAYNVHVSHGPQKRVSIDLTRSQVQLIPMLGVSGGRVALWPRGPPCRGRMDNLVGWAASVSAQQSHGWSPVADLETGGRQFPLRAALFTLLAVRLARLTD